MEVAQGLLPVFFALAVGYLAGKLRVVGNQHVDSLNTVVMKIALPIALFAILAGSARADVIAHGAVAAIVLVVMVAVYAAVYLLQRRVWRTTAADAAVQALTVAFPNTAALALPIAETVLGPTGELAVAVSLAVGSITLSPLTIVILDRASASTLPPAQRRSTSRTIAAALLTPVVIAPIAGLLWSLLGIPFPTLLGSTLGEIGGLTAGLALFVTGLVLSGQSLKPSGNAIVSTLFSDIVRPVLAIGVVWLVGLTGPMASEVILLLAVPSGFFGVLLALSKGAKADIAGPTLFYSTVLSALTLPIVIALLPQLVP